MSQFGIKACIFDLDGVIVDTAKYHFVAWQELARKIGFEFDEVFNEKLKGVSRVESLKLILSEADVELSPSEFDQYLHYKNQHYLELIQEMDKSEILPGVLPYLTRLSKKGIPIALGSASKNAKTILERVELIDFFDFISDGTMVTKSKPDPEVFLLCSTFFGLDPKEIAVYEDSQKGIEAAHTAGFLSIGVGSSSELSNAHINIPHFTNHSFDHLKLMHISR